MVHFFIFCGIEKRFYSKLVAQQKISFVQTTIKWNNFNKVHKTMYSVGIYNFMSTWIFKQACDELTANAIELQCVLKFQKPKNERSSADWYSCTTFSAFVCVMSSNQAINSKNWNIDKIFWCSMAKKVSLIWRMLLINHIRGIWFCFMSPVFTFFSLFLVLFSSIY